MPWVETSLTASLWHALRGDAGALEALRLCGPKGGLPSRFEVSDLASASVAVASLAAAELWAWRRNDALPKVTVSRPLAAAAFRCERLLQPLGWTLPAMWDRIAGDYQAADGWIRLHTNYAHHRDAVTGVLGVAADPEHVAAAVKTTRATELETAIVDAGGCAAAMRTIDTWREHPQGRALATEPLCDFSVERAPQSLSADVSAPLGGLRVLDLTRVIAGPVGTRLLAAFGAEVLRIDPPGFEEVGALLPETTRGKRCAALDLRKEPGALLDLATDGDPAAPLPHASALLERAQTAWARCCRCRVRARSRVARSVGPMLQPRLVATRRGGSRADASSSMRRREQYDVVVAGGGAAGLGAAVGARRLGARVLLVERYGFLGGAVTNANVLSYCGFQVQGERPRPMVGGVGADLLDSIAALEFDTTPQRVPSGNWIEVIDPGAVKHAFDRVIARERVEVRLHCTLVAAQRNGPRIRAVTLFDHAATSMWRRARSSMRAERPISHSPQACRR